MSADNSPAGAKARPSTQAKVMSPPFGRASTLSGYWPDLGDFAMSCLCR